MRGEETPLSVEASQGSHFFPLVGIGASAGGLEAISSLLEHLPATSGMAYVVVQHLDPAHHSALTNLLTRVTSMPVSEVRQNIPAEVDQVYVIPPGTEMIIEQGIFRLSPRKEVRGPQYSIDLFFRSLAQSQGSQTIGVLLSGSGSDGTAGLQVLKEAGGMTFAQDLGSASFAEMPYNAITAGCVDMVLPPEQIAYTLAQLSHHSYLKPSPVSGTQEAPEERPFTFTEQAFQQILQLLYHKIGVDFTTYKTTTLRRRVLRRMALAQVEDPERYLTLLQGSQEEVEALYRDLLIVVTSFFRDPATFALLHSLVLPRLMEQKAPGAPLRIWVPGCATGEEVYSLAICLLEFFAESPAPSLQIFGTDLHPTVIEHARAGIYSPAALTEVNDVRLQRFFDQVNGNYQIAKAVREVCVFSQQNVCQDPPFSRLDLVSCRNVLIYFGAATQNKILQAFHYALGPGGFLILGASETVGRSSELFATVENNHRVYVKKAVTPRATRPPFHLYTPPEERREHASHTFPISQETQRVSGGDVLKEADLLLLTRYAPASVVIDSQLEILQLRGSTRTFLEPAAGRASFHLLKMARAGLGLPLRTAIQQARKRGVAVKKENILLSDRGESGSELLMTLEVIPLKSSSHDACFLILFETTNASFPLDPETALRSVQSIRKRQRGIKDRRIQQLELELATVQQEMQAFIEELEAVNEELQSANEESLSTNEELQSLNEELETSKEEIESTNEELVGVNQELRQRNEQLTEAHTYAEAIIETMGVPLMILNADLLVLRVNRAFCQYFQVDASAAEQHSIYLLGNAQWDIPALRALLEDILPENHQFEGFEVTHQFPVIGHKSLRLNARRLARETSESLILLAFEDVTEREETERQRKELGRRKDEFIGMASHELRTPLTSIKMYMHLLHRAGEQTGDERLRSILTKVDMQLDALTQLIGEMLDITHMEKGVLSSREEVFDLAELVREVVHWVQLTTKHHQIHLEGEGPIQVVADRERVGQVFTNLLTNALKYSPQGGDIPVMWKAEVERVTLSVQDHGIGISEEDQAHIFERFYRAPDAEHQHFPGMGLGLYLSAAIVTQQGGEIWVRSREGEGSTFFFTLLRPPHSSP